MKTDSSPWISTAYCSWSLRNGETPWFDSKWDIRVSQPALQQKLPEPRTAETSRTNPSNYLISWFGIIKLTDEPEFVSSQNGRITNPTAGRDQEELRMKKTRLWRQNCFPRRSVRIGCWVDWRIDITALETHSPRPRRSELLPLAAERFSE